MPKKPPPNAFYFFMKEVQQRMKDRGDQKVPSMMEMPKLCSPEWNRLTPEQKAPYEQRVRDFRRHRTQTDDGRFTSDGIPIQELQRLEEEALEKVRVIETAVRSLITTIHSSEEIAQTSFFIMGFNILIGTYEKLYLPNEVGIVEYSIRDGIKNTYHDFIDPGPIPVGYTSAAKQFSETRHCIPISGFLKATKDYGKVYSRIRRFLGISSQTETRYIFCHPEEIEQYQRCLDWLRAASGSQTEEEIIFASLAVLLDEMRNSVGQSFAFKSVALDAITTSAFDYSPSTLCDYHEEIDVKYCALGYCKRLGFVLSDNLCNCYGVPYTSRHFPERQEVMETVQWRPKGPLRPVVNQVEVPVKPIKPHVPTTIISNVRSKFVEEDFTSVTPSALSETSSVISETPSMDDDDMFPSLARQLDNFSISSETQQENCNGASWAQVSSGGRSVQRKPKPMPTVAIMNQQPPPVFHIAPGIGRGRGLFFQNKRP